MTVLHLLGFLWQDECEGELAVAMPLLESALAALNTLTKADITEVSTALRPCTAFGLHPSKLASNLENMSSVSWISVIVW